MSKHHVTLQDQATEFLLYTAPNGSIKVEVLLRHETIWLTQKRMAELFGVGVAAISKHLDNIYESGELLCEATVSILETVQHLGYAAHQGMHHQAEQFGVVPQPVGQLSWEPVCLEMPS